MAKKLGKVLLCTALIGSAVAGGMALYNKYKASGDDFDDDSFDFDDDDDFDDIADEEDTKDSDREYVSIPRESEDSAKADESPVNVEVTIQSDDSSEADEDISASASADTAETL
ncbi:MAG: hypothetical protein K2O02_08020 [Lachnospiraceae bacterium]|nr:hypothetical protein [Lachnospiraceae bacterium]